MFAKNSHLRKWNESQEKYLKNLIYFAPKDINKLTSLMYDYFLEHHLHED